MSTALPIVLAAVASFAVTWILGFAVIPWLCKLQFGRTILPADCARQNNPPYMPTMGGILPLAGVLSAIVVALATDALRGGHILVGDYLVPLELQSKVISGLLMALSFALVGFVHDYIRCVRKRDSGMNARQKTAAQMLVIFAYLWSLYLSMHQKPYMYIPFVGNVELGFFFWIFGFAVLCGTVNAVNRTDGTDGLCTSVTLTTAVALLVIAAMRRLYGVSLVAAALAGGCGGFLVWNRPRAKVSMGETGTMFLGGMVVAIAYAVGCPLVLLPVGLVYAVEAVWSVLQAIRFKRKHNERQLKTQTIHHRLKQSGRSDRKIICVYTAVNIIGCGIGILCMIR